MRLRLDPRPSAPPASNKQGLAHLKYDARLAQLTSPVGKHTTSLPFSGISHLFAPFFPCWVAFDSKCKSHCTHLSSYGMEYTNA
jgi:hypothetical protein